MVSEVAGYGVSGRRYGRSAVWLGQWSDPTIALPFKLIFFVLVDSWTLVAGSLVQSYGS